MHWVKAKSNWLVSEILEGYLYLVKSAYTVYIWMIHFGDNRYVLCLAKMAMQVNPNKVPTFPPYCIAKEEKHSINLYEYFKRNYYFSLQAFLNSYVSQLLCNQ